MKQPIQPRAQKTRARLMAAANEITAAKGFEALRVEDVVAKAGVAKGTFFAHFKDKDALMDLMLGALIEKYLDQMEAGPDPQNLDEVVDALMPLCEFMVHERYVFDVILRYSGAAAVEDIGPIAATFVRYIEIVSRWMQRGDAFRTDVAPELLAEGVQAFVFQVMALNMCALHCSEAMQDRLRAYLAPWLFAPRPV